MSKRTKVEKQEDKKEGGNTKVGKDEKGSEKDQQVKHMGERDYITFGEDANAATVLGMSAIKAKRTMMQTTVILIELLSFLNLGDSVPFVVTCGFLNKQLSFRLPGQTTYSISQGFRQMHRLIVSEMQLSICYPVISQYLTRLTLLRVYSVWSHIPSKNVFCRSYPDMRLPSSLTELRLPTVLINSPGGLFHSLENCEKNLQRLTTTMTFDATVNNKVDETTEKAGLGKLKLCFKNLTFLKLHSQMQRGYPRVDYKQQSYFWKSAPNLSQLILSSGIHSEESQNIARAGREGYLQSLTTLSFTFHNTDQLLDLTGLKCLQTLTIFEFNNLSSAVAPATNRYSVPPSLEKICLHNVHIIPITVLMKAPNLRHFELNCATRTARWRDVYSDMPDIHAIHDACPLMEVFIIRDRYSVNFLDIRRKLTCAQGWIYDLCDDAFTNTMLVNLKIFAIVQIGRMHGRRGCASSVSHSLAYGDPTEQGLCLCKRILGREDAQELVKKIAIVRPNLRFNVEIDKIYIDTHCDGMANSVSDQKDDLAIFPAYRQVPVEKRKLFHLGKEETNEETKVS